MISNKGLQAELHPRIPRAFADRDQVTEVFQLSQGSLSVQDSRMCVDGEAVVALVQLENHAGRLRAELALHRLLIMGHDRQS